MKIFKISRPQFLIITILLLLVVVLLAYIVDLEDKNAELRRFIAVELRATRERLNDVQERLGEVDAMTLRIMYELGVGRCVMLP